MNIAEKCLQPFAERNNETNCLNANRSYSDTMADVGAFCWLTQFHFAPVPKNPRSVKIKWILFVQKRRFNVYTSVVLSIQAHFCRYKFGDNFAKLHCNLNLYLLPTIWHTKSSSIFLHNPNQIIEFDFKLSDFRFGLKNVQQILQIRFHRLFSTSCCH